jgi:hypothetical protein
VPERAWGFNSPLAHQRCHLVRYPRAVKRDLTVDAIVAATAMELAPSVVLTGDAADLELLVEGFVVRVSVI